MKKKLLIMSFVLVIAQMVGVVFVFAGNNLQFSEIAWMGTATSSNDEWIELRNNSAEPIDLTGWKVIARDGAPVIDLAGSVTPGGFYLLERTSDDTILDIAADMIYGGALGNTGEFLELFDSTGVAVDAVDASVGWQAGDNATKQTMEWSGDGWVMSVSAGGTPKADRGNVIVIDPVSTTTPVVESPIVNNDQVPIVVNNNLPVAKKYLLGDVVINEFASDPGSGEDEWVEFFNNTDNDIDLNNWTVVEGSGKETVLNGIVPAHKYFVLEKIKGNLNNDGDVMLLRDVGKNLIDKVAYGNWDDGQLKDNAPVANDPKSVARKIDGYNSFNNDFDFIKTNQSTKGAGNIILNEELQSIGVPPTLIKVDALASTTASSTIISTSSLQIINDSDLNKATTAKATTTNKNNLLVKINEIFPSPDGGDADGEWIELYNGGAEKINLRNWRIDDDEAGGSKPHQFIKDVWIMPKGFYVLKRTESNLALNNDSDKVVLRDGDGKLVDKISYEKTISGQSYVRNDKGEWSWSMSATPGEKNQLIQKEVFAEKVKISATQGNNAVVLDIPAMVSLEDVRKAEKGAYILVGGIVTALPGVLGSQYFYIGVSQKSENGPINLGLQIYSNKKDFPDLKIGDEVEVIGEISEINGEKRLKTVSKRDIRIVNREQKILPQKVTCENIDDSLLGALVEVEGEVSDIKATGIYLDDGMDEVLAYVKKTTGIDYKEYKEALRLKITGIVVSAKSEVRLLPRNKDDIIILEKKEPVDSEKSSDIEQKVLGVKSDNSDLIIEQRDGGKEALKYYLILGAGSVLLFLIWFFKFRK